MRARRRTVLVALLGAVLVTAGCGAAPAEPAAPPNPLPPRPKNLDLSNVDLCSLLTPAQREERGIDRDRLTTATVNGEKVPSCSWTDNDTSDYWAVQVFQGPVSAVLQNPGSYAITISGFGAVRGPIKLGSGGPGSTPVCAIDLDASDTQSMRVLHDDRQGDGSKPADQEAACQTLIRFAEDIYAALSRRPG